MSTLGMAEILFSSGRLRRAVPVKCAKCHFDNPADTPFIRPLRDSAPGNSGGRIKYSGIVYFCTQIRL